MNNITIILGVRPHYVKACGLKDILKNTTINPIFFDVHQHYDDRLRNIYIESNGIFARTNSSVTKANDPIDDIVRQIKDVSNWLNSDEGRKTKAVVVLGDANPALTGAFAANRLDFPIIHIEAGVRRVLNEKEHWNSLIADHLSCLRYCYTKKSFENLTKEGLSQNSFLVGDILANWTIDKSKLLKNNNLYGNYCLVSIHRPQNCNIESIIALCSAIKKLEKKIVWIIHPRIKQFEHVIHKLCDVILLESQPHDDALRLLKYSDIVITDSGGFVREGVLLSKPVVVCHEQGMWEDLIINNAITKADMTEESILTAIKKSITLNHEYGKKFFIKEDGVSLFVDSLTEFLNKV